MMDINEFRQMIYDLFPYADIEEKPDGQFVVYTGYARDPDDNTQVVEFD